MNLNCKHDSELKKKNNKNRNNVMREIVLMMESKINTNTKNRNYGIRWSKQKQDRHPSKVIVQVSNETCL